MKKRNAALIIVCAMVLVAVTLCSCWGTGKIKLGNLTGQVVTSTGEGIGYMSVALFDVETGTELQRQNAEDRGNFFFKEVAAGTYSIKLFDVTGTEMPIEPIEVKLGTGKTKTVVVTLLPEMK